MRRFILGVDLALEYANGPAYVGFGYNRRDLGNVAAANVGVSTVIGAPGTVNGYTLGGAYDFGVVKPFINYTRQTTDISGSTVAPVGFVSSSNVSNGNARALSVGLRAPVGPFTVIAGFGRVNTDNNGSAVTTTAANPGVTTVTSTTQVDRRDAFQVGAQYALSKRTLVEGNYGYSKLRGNGSSVVSNSVVRTDTSSNERTSSLNVGLKHSF